MGNCVTQQNLITASKRVKSEGGLRPQWVILPENEDLVEKTNKKSKEVIGALKTGKTYV